MDNIIALTKILQKYLGIKMYIEHQEEFKEEFFRELFDPQGYVDYSLRSTLFINAVLEEDNLPFYFRVKKENGDAERKYETYWELVDLNKIK